MTTTDQSLNRKGRAGRSASRPRDTESSLANFLVRHRSGVGLMLATGILYLLTLQDGLLPYQLQGGDLITHQYAQVQGRFSNAPGYPLYTLGGWLWFHVGRLLLGPAHNPVSILSSYSTLWALIALWILHLLILDVTDRGDGGNQVVAMLVGAFYAATYFFWYYAVTTEQYTSAVAWTLAAIWLAFRWERTRQDRYLLWLSLLAGVALAHMLTLPLIIPPLLWFVLSREPKLLHRPRLIAAAIGLAALPLFSYGYVYMRGLQHPEWRGAGQWASTWQWFLGFISTGQGRSELTWSWTPFLTPEFPSLIWREMTVPGLLLGLLGLALLRRPRAITLYAMVIIYTIFCWIDRLGNWFQVIMPVYALLALGIAVAADRVWKYGSQRFSVDTQPDRIKRRQVNSGRSKAAPTLILVFLVGLVLYRLVASYPQANMRGRAEAQALAPGWAILADDPPAGAHVLATLPEDLALGYLTEIWGVRPDLVTVTASDARAMLATGSAPLLATTGFLPLVPQEISPEARYSAIGRTLSLVSLMPNRTPPAGLSDWNEDFSAGLRLAGGRVTRNDATGETVALLAWQVQESPQGDFSISVRLMRHGVEIAQLDHQAPIDGAYPTSRWLPGEIVVDAYPFALPAGKAPDGLKVILYCRNADGSYANLHVAQLPLN